MLRINRLYSLLISRNASYWNKDWRPGPYPKTEQERIAAAKKYGMLPEDYKPYPDDGFGYGDYPMLPVKSTEARDPYAVWDEPTMRRNYGEPVHVDADIYTEDRCSPELQQLSYLTMAKWLFGTMFVMVVLMNFSPDVGWRLQMMPKHIPEPGVTHYSFEPIDGEEKIHKHH